MRLLLLAPLALLFCAFQSPTTTTPEAYGAAGNGTSDDAAALKAALNSGHDVVVFDGTKTYRSSQQLVVPSGVTIRGNGATIKPLSSLSTAPLYHFITTENKTIYSASASVTVTENSRTFTYNAAGALEKGSLILLKGPEYAVYNSAPYKMGWFSVVTNISGSTVTLEHPAPASFKTVEIVQYKTNRNVHITDLHIDMTGRTTGVGCALTNAISSTMENLYIESTQYTGIAIGAWLRDCLHSRIDNLTVLNGEAQDITAFGIDIQGQEDTVSNCAVNGFNQPIISADGSYISQGLQILSNHVSNSLGGTGSALDFHGNAQGVMDGNVIYYTNTYDLPIHAIHIRSDNTTVSNNIVYMETGTNEVFGVFGFENMTKNINVVNNTFRFTGDGGARMFLNSAKVLAPTENLRINGNLVYGGRITIVGPVGDGFQLNNNWLEQNGTVYPCISLPTDYLGKNGSISYNTFVNKNGDNMNYSISTSKTAAPGWVIANNKVYIQSSNNSYPQFRINNITNKIEDNAIFTNAGTPFIKDYSGTTDVNRISGNRNAARSAPGTTSAGAGTPALVLNLPPDAMPPATVNGTYLAPWKTETDTYQ